MAPQRGGFLRVEVNLVDVDAVKKPAVIERLDEEEEEQEDDVFRAMMKLSLPEGAFISRASLAEGPSICGAKGTLPTGARVGRGFRPERLITHSPDGTQRFEWACRGGILTHMLVGLALFNLTLFCTPRLQSKHIRCATAKASLRRRTRCVHLGLWSRPS
jgi:hypothetical protein